MSLRSGLDNIRPIHISIRIRAVAQLSIMSPSAGLLTPRGPFSGAAPLALRPLSAIAASVAGGVPESRIKRLLSDLLPSLISLHAQGEICGDISLETVGMDESARAHLVPELIVARSRRVSRSPTPGFAPFELYTDSMEWPRGPWTDIYALCAVMHALVTGRRPPPAPERRASDTYEPLASLGLPKYSQDFLSVIDAGLSMEPADRPQTLAELAEMLGVAAQVETALREQVARIAREGISEAELERVKTQWVAGEVYKRDSLFFQAREIGTQWILGLPLDTNEQMLQRLRAITAAQVQSVAARYFGDDQLTVGELLPQPRDPNRPRRTLPPGTHH